MPIPEGENKDEHLSRETEVLPPENSLNKTETGGMSVSYRAGPISPSELREYDQMSPGFAQAYLKEVLEGASHSRKVQVEELQLEKLGLDLEAETVKVEERIFNSNQARSVWGSIAGFVIAMTAIGCTTYLGLQGHKEAAIAVAGSLSVATIAIYGTDAFNKNKQKQLETNISNSEIAKTLLPPN